MGVDGAEEEERSGLDERGRFVVDLGLDDDGFEHVGDPAAVKLVLQNALLFSVEAAHDLVLSWWMVDAGGGHGAAKVVTAGEGEVEGRRSHGGV